MLDDSALQEMLATKRKFGKMDKRQGYHYIISFKKQEVRMETVMKKGIGRGRYSLLSTNFVKSTVFPEDISLGHHTKRLFLHRCTAPGRLSGSHIGITQKDNMFVSMPDYKTGWLDDNGKDVYQDIAYPVTRQFRPGLYDEIVKEFNTAIEQEGQQAGKEE